MKSALPSQNKASYLDVTQFILKECSPLIKPKSPTYRFSDQNTQRTPEILPIDHDGSSFYMTPLCTGICQPRTENPFEEFDLQANDDFTLEYKTDQKFKQYKVKQTRPRSNSFLQFCLGDDLLNIIPELQNEEQINFGLTEEQDQQQDKDYSDEQQNSKYLNYGNQFKQMDEEKQSTLDISTAQFNDAIQRFKQNPKRQIIKQMKEIQMSRDFENDYQKRETIKNFIEKYFLEFQMYCYEEAWKMLQTQNLNFTIKKIIQGLDETFSKKIGSLSFQVRRTKILKYLQKKKKRIWRKKVSYDCRKKVADGRLRIKGKFVTRQQACQQLGLVSLSGLSPDEIKYMLQRRIEGKQYDLLAYTAE